METILSKVIEAHGGLTNWEKFKKVQATITSGGLILDIHHIPHDPTPRNVTAWFGEERSSIRPVGAPDRFTDFTPTRIAVQNDSGNTLLERTGTPEELHQHMKQGIWDPLDRATFNGYAMWTYLTTPFFMTMPGITVTEIEPWVEKGEKWHCLEVQFPEHMLSHSTVQQFYFGDDYLLRRQDYYVDVAGQFYAAQYVSDMIDVEGIKFPTKRRVYKRNEDGTPIPDQLMVWIDLSNIQLQSK